MRSALPGGTFMLALALFVLSAGPASAEPKLMVLPLDVTRTEGRMPPAARVSMEEMLRDVATNALAASGWTVMDNANTIELLRSNGVDPAACEGECHLETARKVATDNFISGVVQWSEGEFTASVRLLETSSGRILASERLEGATVKDLRQQFEARAAHFFERSGLLDRAASAPHPAQARTFGPPPPGPVPPELGLDREPPASTSGAALAARHAALRAEDGAAEAAPIAAAWTALAQVPAPNPWLEPALARAAAWTRWLEGSRYPRPSEEREAEARLSDPSSSPKMREEVLGNYVAAYGTAGITAAMQAVLDDPSLPFPVGSALKASLAPRALQPGALEFVFQPALSGAVPTPAFWLSRTEVTNAAWDACVTAGYCKDSGVRPVGVSCVLGDFGRTPSGKPRVCVSAEEAETFCGAAGGRLPAEAEWEAAAAGPAGLKYPWGNTPGPEGRVAARSDDAGEHREGASWRGVLDLLGGVWEWTATSRGALRVLRGGASGMPLDQLDNTAQQEQPPRKRLASAGFRCLVPATPAQAPAKAPALTRLPSPLQLGNVQEPRAGALGAAWKAARTAEAVGGMHPLEASVAWEAVAAQVGQGSLASLANQRALSWQQTARRRAAEVRDLIAIDKQTTPVGRMRDDATEAQRAAALSSYLERNPKDDEIASHHRANGTVFVAGGPARVGCVEGDSDCKDAESRRSIVVSEFALGRTEVTAQAYAACVQAGDCSAAGDASGCNAGKADRTQHPINCVNWEQARAYCASRGERLPEADEWEVAARGRAERIYPWGNQSPDDERVRTSGYGTMPVGSRPMGASADGLLDLAGNVAEWTASDAGKGEKQVRGGSSKDWPRWFRNSARKGVKPSEQSPEIGFRCAR